MENLQKNNLKILFLIISIIGLSFFIFSDYSIDDLANEDQEDQEDQIPDDYGFVCDNCIKSVSDNRIEIVQGIGAISEIENGFEFDTSKDSDPPIIKVLRDYYGFIEVDFKYTYISGGSSYYELFKIAMVEAGFQKNVIQFNHIPDQDRLSIEINGIEEMTYTGNINDGFSIAVHIEFDIILDTMSFSMQGFEGNLGFTIEGIDSIADSTLGRVFITQGRFAEPIAKLEYLTVNGND